MTEEEMNSTNWSQSVGGVCIRNGKVLLGRHTYGSGNGKLIIPGGYVKFGETPEEALIREFEEETGVTVLPEKLVGIRFNTKDWYAVFKVSYVEGEARSDGDENSEVIWMNVDEALKDETVPGLTKTMIERTLTGGGFNTMPYQTTKPGSRLYSC